jgi:Fe-S oxidoreductase
MCPSYRVTRDELHSTRGRANALRAALSGELGAGGMYSAELHDALDLCLECKACKHECPSIVDMARLKSEYLAHYQAERGVPWRSRLFGHIHAINRIGSRTPGLANRSFTNRLFRTLLDRSLGIDQRRELPPLARESFQQWFKTKDKGERLKAKTKSRGKVVLWDDTYTSFNETEIGKAAV